MDKSKESPDSGERGYLEVNEHGSWTLLVNN